jgi:hypothetical protein
MGLAEIDGGVFEFDRRRAPWWMDQAFRGRAARLAWTSGGKLEKSP